MQKIDLSDEAHCADSKHCIVLTPRGIVRFLDKNKRFYIWRDRVYVPVETKAGGKEYFMDAVTGTLFNIATGKSRTSKLIYPDTIEGLAYEDAVDIFKSAAKKVANLKASV